MKKAAEPPGISASKDVTGFGSTMGQKLRNNFARKAYEFRLRKKRLMEFGLRRHLLPRRVKHIHGPAEISYDLNELLVISVVRNGELYINSFMDHYRAMGVKHFVFLDNGSTDDTLEMLCALDGVTVLQTDAPYNKYENAMKRYLAEGFSHRRWNLCADIDELFDYPFSSTLSLADFLGYLNHNNYTAVVAQMLDMFSDVTLNNLKSQPDDLLGEKYVYYDISSIDKEEYLWSERSNPAIKMHWGGIRKMVFGTINGLTKAALVLMDGRVRPFITWHHPKGARMADISCLLRHYPFVSSFQAKVEDAARTGRYGMRVTDEYRMYAKRLNSDVDLNLKLGSARCYAGTEPLIEEEFLVISERYRQWVANHPRKRR